MLSMESGTSGVYQRVSLLCKMHINWRLFPLCCHHSLQRHHIVWIWKKKTRKISLNQSHIVLKMKSAKVCTNSLHCPVFGIEVEVIKAHWVHKAILFWYCSILSLVNTLWSLWCAIVLEMMIRCLLVQPSTLKIDLLRLPSEQLTTSRSTWPM